MSYQLINSTLPIVLEEIENVLEESPNCPYRAAFIIPELREKLIDYVLSKIPHYYTIESSKSSIKQLRPPFRLLEQRLQLENLIRKGIFELIRENTDWENFRFSHTEESNT
ncbi:hypothetical protein [Kamptonema sp. UHCC 0994]|uniref:hypothetical protein n=1 Tax=Kamptonema sp. UHCC 0994 TaxID=3031329 RepID=UPI0023BADD46|nr:hypothetical protein [Kamptonema sp. UHCC 0994]MDF0556715.1 hypothetical protein [Kamptonema sp. UHCC 0994]